jgi:hypothetical protein
MPTEKQALIFYNKILKALEKAIGLESLSTSTLEDWGSALIPNFAGVFARDRTPKKGIFIANLDAHDEAGSHWVAVYDGMVYDSYGRTFKDLGKPNDLDAEQGLAEINCGHRSLAWLCVYYYFGKSFAVLI